MGKKALEGVKIADFGWVVVGPVTTKILSDYGADVIKIEGRTRADYLRFTRPFKDGIQGVDRGGDFNQYSAGKKSLALNLSHPKGKEIAKRLAAWADVVTENFAGGAMNKLGLGYEDMRKVNPAIIMLSSCMQGQTGPHSQHPGFGWHLAALSGFSNIAGWPDRFPAEIGPYTDHLAPRFNAIMILAALDHRDRTGKGQYLDMSQFENGVQFMTPLVLDYVVNKRIAQRIGNRLEYAAPHASFRCRSTDRWCAISVFTDREWKDFCTVIGNPLWTSDKKFATLLGRKNNEDELERLIECWTVQHSSEEIMALMQAEGVAAGTVNTPEDLLDKDPQLKQRRVFREVAHPEVGKYKVPGPPYVLSKSVNEVKRAPLLGEHNESVLKEVVGLSEDEIAELVVEGVLE